MVIRLHHAFGLVVLIGIATGNPRNLGATPAAINYIQVGGSFGGTNTFTDQNLSFVNLAAIPESSAYAGVFGLAALAAALVVRRRS